MHKYTPYEPEAQNRLPRLNLSPRLAEPDDAEAMARLAQARDGGDLNRRIEKYQAEIALGQDDGALFVARLDGALLGYARILYFDAKQPVRWPSPPGWYCRGMMVDPAWQRRGVASALAGFRLVWLHERAPGAALYSFANARNLASCAYHREQGFTEAGRAAGYLDVDFDDGEGILYRLQV